ncbi:hypothetical protein AX15_005452 [Amanita polypyramis BW_CC]|nr:hypothetical protein AX15_005452 [Amanita polypyramis BW_CC]
MAIDPYKILVSPLPTLTSLNATISKNVDAQKIALDWLDILAEAIESNNLGVLESLFIEDCWWRDMLALTWDFRTFRGLPAVATFLRDRVGSTHPRGFKLYPNT